MTLVILFLLALAAVASPAHGYCLNNTGGCRTDGRFECLDGSTVPDTARCDDKADCEDGMDEFKCPRRLPSGNATGNTTDHEEHEQMSCGPTCACLVASQTVPSGGTFFNEALAAPIWGGLMAGTPTPATMTWGCSKVAGKTASVVIEAYKKGSSTCVGNVRKRGFLCCIRQKTCNCGTGAGIRCA